MDGDFVGVGTENIFTIFIDRGTLSIQIYLQVNGVEIHLKLLLGIGGQNCGWESTDEEEMATDGDYFVAVDNVVRRRW